MITTEVKPIVALSFPVGSNPTLDVVASRGQEWINQNETNQLTNKTYNYEKLAPLCLCLMSDLNGCDFELSLMFRRSLGSQRRRRELLPGGS
jgi:hypothetical protein